VGRCRATELAQRSSVSSAVSATATDDDALHLKEVKANEAGPNKEGGRDRSLVLTKRGGFTVASALTPAWGTDVRQLAWTRGHRKGKGGLWVLD
jgi:hypothetical protein